MLTINPRVAISVLLVTLIGLVIGTWADERWPNTLEIPAVVVGIGAGIMFGFALGLYIVHQRRRWIAVAALATFLLIVLVTGGLGSTALAIASIVLTFVVTAGVLRDLYDGSEVAAIKSHLSIMTSIRGGFLVVDGGKIVVPSTAPPHLGPKLVIVRPGNIVVMVNGGSISRICGPSVFMSRNFEYVSKVIPTERKRKTLSLNDVVPKDTDPVSVSISYVFGLNVTPETIRGRVSSSELPDGSRGITETERDIIHRVVALYPDWEQELGRALQGAIRNVFAQYNFEELINVNDYSRIGRKIEYMVHSTATRIGSRVEMVTVAAIEPNATYLTAHVEGQRLRNMQHAAGDAFALAIRAVAGGYFEAQKLGMSVDDIHREATRFMMEHMTDDPATKVVLTSPANYSLDDIQGPPSIADDAIDGDQPRRISPTARDPGARA